MVQGAINGMVQGVAKSQMRLSGFHITHLLVPDNPISPPKMQLELGFLHSLL